MCPVFDDAVGDGEFDAIKFEFGERSVESAIGSDVADGCFEFVAVWLIVVTEDGVEFECSEVVDHPG